MRRLHGPYESGSEMQVNTSCDRTVTRRIVISAGLSPHSCFSNAILEELAESPSDDSPVHLVVVLRNTVSHPVHNPPEDVVVSGRKLRGYVLDIVRRPARDLEIADHGVLHQLHVEECDSIDVCHVTPDAFNGPCKTASNTRPVLARRASTTLRIAARFERSASEDLKIV